MAIKFLSSGNVTGGLVVAKPANASVEIAKFEIDGTGGSFGSLSFVSIVPGSGNYATQLRLYTNNTGDFNSLTNNAGQLELATNDNNPLVLKTNLTTRLTISATGVATFTGNVIIDGTATIGGSDVITRSGTTAQGRLAIWQNDSAIKGDNNLFYASQYLTIGVGTAGGFAALRINAATTAETYLDFTEGATFTKRAQIQVDTNDNMYFRNTSNNTLALTIDSSQNATFAENVGIGISPGENLHIFKSDATALIQASNTSGIAQVQFFPRDASNVAHLQSIKGVDSNLTFLTGGNSGNSYVPTERMRITSGGNVGIGLILPGAKLDVLQEARVSYANSNQYTLRITNTDGNPRILADGSAAHLIFGTTPSGSTTATERMRIQNDGNVGIGMTLPEEKLMVSGAITSTGSNATFFTSGTNRVGMDLTSGGARIGHFRGTTAAGSGYVSLYSDSFERVRINAAGDLYNVNNTTSTFFGNGTGNLGFQTGVHNAGFGYTALAGLTSGAQNVGIGNFSLQSVTTGSNNVGVGYNAGGAISSADANTMIGYAAGASITTGTRNTVVGYAAADAIGVGGMNYTVAIGSFALTAATNTTDASVIIGDAAAGNSSGFSSGVAIGHAAAYTNTANALVAIGYESGFANTGLYNTFLGYQTGRFNTAGHQNTAMGYQALYTNTSGLLNTAIGMQTLYYNTTASYNTAIGQLAGFKNTIGAENTYLGSRAGQELTTGSFNIGIGSGALFGSNGSAATQNIAIGVNAMSGATTAVCERNTIVGQFGADTITTGAYNVGIGYSVFTNATTATSNVAVGYFSCAEGVMTGSGNAALGMTSLRSITSGTDNVAIGTESLRSLTTGANNVSIGTNALYSYTGSKNTAVGFEAGKSINSDGDNVFVGYNAGKLRTGGIDNTAVGSFSQYGGTSGSTPSGCCNSSFGFATLHNISTGVQNTAIGRQAGYSITTTDNNTLVGHNVGIFGTGSLNTIVGAQAGSKAGFTGNNNTFLGYTAGDEVTTGGQNLVLGYAAGSGSSPFQLTTQAYRIILGDNSSTDAYIKIDWTVTSDKRDKTDFKEIEHGLDFVDKLKPTEYKFRKNRDTEETDGKRRYGFIAQEILELEGEDSVIIDTEQKDNLKYKQSHLVPVLVKAIQELKAEIELLKKK